MTLTETAFVLALVAMVVLAILPGMGETLINTYYDVIAGALAPDPGAE